MTQSQVQSVTPESDDESRFGTPVEVFGIRSDVGSSGDGVYINDDFEYEKPGAQYEYVNNTRVYKREDYIHEKSVVAVADAGYIEMGVPLVDIAKYLLQHEPGLLERARQELGLA